MRLGWKSLHGVIVFCLTDTLIVDPKAEVSVVHLNEQGWRYLTIMEKLAAYPSDFTKVTTPFPL